MKTYHLVQLRYPGQERFSSPLAIEVEGLYAENVLEIAFKRNPSAAEGGYIKEITQEEYLTRVAEYGRPS